jgi:hypothetical protein
MPAHDPYPGLCGDCRHARRVPSAHGATFYLCRRAFDDPAYKRYPALPVLTCSGYEAERSAPVPDRGPQPIKKE